MNSNMGTVDRVIRLLLAIVVGVLYFTGQIGGITAIVLGVLALVFLLTSVVSFCPLYAPFKISTKPKEN
jgi:Inner membrane protein YgaP-like, transmembrane domain